MKWLTAYNNWCIKICDGFDKLGNWVFDHSAAVIVTTIIAFVVFIISYITLRVG